MSLKTYNIDPQVYTESKNINIDPRCNSIAFQNTGDTAVRINSIWTLFPSSAPATIAGDFFSINGNEMEKFGGTIRIQFVAPVGAAPRLEVIQQFYPNLNKE